MKLALILVAAVLFAVASFSVPTGRVNLVAAGLCLVAVAAVVP